MVCVKHRLHNTQCLVIKTDYIILSVLCPIVGEIVMVLLLFVMFYFLLNETPMSATNHFPHIITLEIWGHIHKEILSLRQKIVSAFRFGLR